MAPQEPPLIHPPYKPQNTSLAQSKYHNPLPYPHYAQNIFKGNMYKAITPLAWPPTSVSKTKTHKKKKKKKEKCASNTLTLSQTMNITRLALMI